MIDEEWKKERKKRGKRAKKREKREKKSGKKKQMKQMRKKSTEKIVKKGSSLSLIDCICTIERGFNGPIRLFCSN